MSKQSGFALFAIVALFVAALILGGCAASAPTPEKMGEAMLKAMPHMAAAGRPPSGKEEDVELPAEAVKAIESIGVSEASFRAGLKKAKEDEEYGKEVGKALAAEMMKMVPKGGMPMAPHGPMPGAPP